MFLRLFDVNVEIEYIINSDNIEYISEISQDYTCIHLKSGETITTHWNLNKIQIALENSNNRIVYDLLYEDKYTGKRMKEIKDLDWEEAED